MFNIDLCKIRLADPKDKAGLTAMSKTIWDGQDYIPTVVDKWIADGHFFVAEYLERIVGCVKVSQFPDNALWFEGLRVHQKFQGNGIGSLLNHFAFGYAHELQKKNPQLAFEFCTYYQNHESLHMAKLAGFKPVQKWYIFEKRGVKHALEPKIITDYDLSIFKHCKGYIPCGWQAIHNHADSLEWLKSKCTVFQTSQGLYLYGGISEKNILFLNEPSYNIRKELPYFQYFYKPYQKVEIIIASKWKKHLDAIQSLGFEDWKGKLTQPNMLVLRK